MADVHSKEKRSKNMSAIRGRGNRSTEQKFLMLLRKNKINGWRRHPRNVAGRPDFIFPAKQIAIFIDGCFWHGCSTCFIEPKSNVDFWREKISGNQKRDKKNRALLRKQGWKVVRIWEHALKRNRVPLERIR